MRTIWKRSQESVPGVLCSDSDGSLKLLRNLDFSESSDTLKSKEQMNREVLDGTF